MKRMSMYMAGLLAVAASGYAQSWDSVDSGSSIGMPRGAAPSGGSAYKNQILDAADKPAYRAKLGYVMPADFGDFGDSGMFELQGDWEFAYFRDVLAADVDLNFLFRDFIFTSATELKLPSQVMQLALDAGSTWRFEDGTGLQFRGKPGFYSDMGELSGGGLNMPVSLAVVKAFNNELSGLAGVEWRPGFDRPIMPLMTMEMLIQDTVRVRLGLPENRVTYYAAPDFSLYAGLDWQNLTFALSDDDNVDRESLTLDDYRFYIGSGYQMPGQVQLVGEVGQIYERSVSMEYGGSRPDKEVDVDAAMFVRFGLLGMF
jgi:hypothetical protein